MKCDYFSIREIERSKSEFLNSLVSLRAFDSLEEMVTLLRSEFKTDLVKIDNEWQEDLISTTFVSVNNDSYKIRFCRCKDQRDKQIVTILDARCLKG